MDYSLRYAILGQSAVDRWPILDIALDQLADVADVFEGDGTCEVEALLRTEPPPEHPIFDSGTFTGVLHLRRELEIPTLLALHRGEVGMATAKGRGQQHRGLADGA